MRRALQHRHEEAGFTLIELLVVVLILGILMAIAIPTFLNLTTGAKTNSAEADLTTAAQDEAAYLTINGDFDGTTNATPSAADNVSASVTPPGMLGADPGINWTAATTTPLVGSAGKKVVWVVMVNVSALILGTAGQNGSYYWIYDSSGALSYDINTVSTVPATPTTAAPWGLSWKTATTLV